MNIMQLIQDNNNEQLSHLVLQYNLAVKKYYDYIFNLVFNLYNDTFQCDMVLNDIFGDFWYKNDFFYLKLISNTVYLFNTDEDEKVELTEVSFHNYLKNLKQYYDNLEMNELNDLISNIINCFNALDTLYN